MPPLPSTRAIGYVRISDDRQDNERQVREIREYALRAKVELVEIVKDDGSRLESWKRPKFLKMMDRVRAHEVDEVVIQTTDRLGFSQTQEFFAFLWDFTKAGVELWSVLDDRDLSKSDDMTVFTNTISGQTSTKELKEKANRSQGGRVTRGLQGRFLGGMPPYGFDVVCFNKAGAELWRYVMTGRRQGVQHYPSGEKIKVGGVPKHDFYEEPCFLRPSIVTERVEVVKRIFNEYDSTAVSSLVLAKQLNAEGVDAVIAPHWKHDAIWRLLQNSAVIGRPAGNKVTSAKLIEYRDGQLQERQRGAGFERRPADQWVLPDKPIFDPIVPEDQFWRVLKKITGPTKQKRAPRNPELWMAGLVVCGRCGRTMRGSWKESYSGGKPKGTFKARYFCQTRHDLGPTNPTGCRSFGVDQANHLEPLVRQFLQERGAALEDLLASSGDRSRITALFKERREAGVELQDLYRRMEGWIKDKIEEESPGVPIPIPDYREGGAGLLEDLYDQLFEHQSKGLASRLRDLKEEHERIMATIFRLPERSQAQAEKRLHELEAEMDGVEAELSPLSHLVESKRLQWSELGGKIREASRALEDRSLREKAEAIRGAIARIEVHFDLDPRNEKDASLAKVVIFPALEGVPGEVTPVALGSPGRGPPERRCGGRGPRPSR